MSINNFPGTSLILARLLPAFLLTLALPLEARAQAQSDIPGPEGSENFGREVIALPNGNIVVTDPRYDAPGPVANVGAVYLYDGASGALISTMTGSTADDEVGNGGATVLSNGDYVVTSTFWRRSGMINVGAVTYCSGTTGCSGTVSADNSLVGSTSGDLVGSDGITVLANGRYLVRSAFWANGAVGSAGAVTFCSGTGCTGEVTATNSLVGSKSFDHVGTGVTLLSNGNYVVNTSTWDGASASNVGAVTFCDGTTGCTGPVTTANSLVGSRGSDSVGITIVPLTNGNYVVRSPNWDNDTLANAGAATFGSGTTGISGTISAANSLVGSKASDFVSSFGVTALSNGNYVVRSPNWDNGALNSVGAATWCSGTNGCTGTIAASNSLVGSTAGDLVGVGATALSNGDYVVASNSWDNGAINSAGAATWCSGMTGCTGAITPENSLVGSTASDFVGSIVYALTNGNYVVRSPDWDNGAIADVGAATWCSGTTPCTGTIAAANSLIGSTAGDRVSFDGITALSNGNYVVRSNNWDHGAIVDAGAATFGSGTSGISGPVSSSNSLVGSATSDFVGAHGVTALSNGTYVVSVPDWDNGAIADAGAATFGSGTTGISGSISDANSLVGSTAEDAVSSFGITALTNGDYVVSSPFWDNEAIMNAGAISYGSGTGGTVGEITSTNSFLGTTANDGTTLSFDFDPTNNQLIIGRPADNIVTLFRPPGGSLLNIATRLRVGAGENVLIGGFIITGTDPKKVIIRAIGPSLAQFFNGTLDDPTLQLFQGNTPLASNNDWREAEAEIAATGIPPSHDKESAIVRTLAPGSYTAILGGNGGSTGIGVVEVYDLDQNANSTLANIASRGFVDTGDNVMIGGLIVGPAGGASAKVVVRAMGPSLESFGIAGALQDPTLDLVNSNGVVLRANNNWQDSQQAEIEATGLQPGDTRESTLIETLAPGNYTAIVRSAGNTTGVGLVEVYNLQ